MAAASGAELPVAYRELSARGAVLAALPAAEAWALHAIDAHGTLYAAAAAQPGARPLAGRGVAWAIDTPAGPAVLRRYRRGGAVARILSDRYLRAGVNRAWRELAASAEARHRGVPTPEVLAAAVYPAGLFYRADLLTKRIEHAVDLAGLLFGGASAAAVTRTDACRAAGALVRTLERAGVVHPDLNAANVLITGDGAAHALDFDRVRVREAPLDERAARAMLARIERSLAKWERRTGLNLAPAERAALAAGYEESSWNERRDAAGR